MNKDSSVAIVGMGVLGTSLAKQLLESTECSIVGVTKTSSRHDALLKELCEKKEEYGDRVSLCTMEQALQDSLTCNHVVFCAPPSGFDDYPTAISTAFQFLLSSENKEEVGSYIFTSSGGVYPDSFDGEIVTETTSLLSSMDNPRKAKSISAEKACLTNGGCVLRLAGLYTLERGAHNYWLERAPVVKGRDDGFINLLHYDDAASACVAALNVGRDVNGGKVFLISDGNCTTRRGICESALKSERYGGCEMPKFESGEGETRGKIYDGSWSEETLGWKPRYASFDEFMESMS